METIIWQKTTPNQRKLAEDLPQIKTKPQYTYHIKQNAYIPLEMWKNINEQLEVSG